MLNDSMSVNEQEAGSPQVAPKEATRAGVSTAKRSREPDEFLSLMANYNIDPGSKASDLAWDAGIILEGLIATIECLTEGLSDKGSAMSKSTATQVVPMLNNVGYQLQMVKSLTLALDRAEFPS